MRARVLHLGGIFGRYEVVGRILLHSVPMTLVLGACAITHVPPFASKPYQPFSREAVVQIALREWRAFGQPVVEPDTELPLDNERLEGLWQRVGEYWWLGLPMGSDEQGLTGKHN